MKSIRQEHVKEEKKKKIVHNKWYNTLCHSLANIGFKQSMADPAVFYAFIRKKVVVLFIHVDDSTITGSSLALNKVFIK
jgi:hypothetical protein